jgi:penicillin-binding protein 1C
MSGSGRVKRALHFEKSARLVLLALGVLMLLLFAADRVFPPPPPPPFSTQVFDRDGDLLSAFLSADDKWRLRTSIDQLTPELIDALLAKEDRWFRFHPGVNVFAIFRALYANLTEGRRVSGASTITMQVARMLEPGARTYGVKVREMIRALQLELRYSKREILALYVSLLPMGGNLEGVASASWIYFNRPPDKLSLAQSVALAVLPNDPNGLRLDRSTVPLQTLTRQWLRRFASRNVFPRERVGEALEEEFTIARNAPPQRIPQLTQMLAARYHDDILHSTVDADIQDAVERLLFHHVQRVMADGVTNGAVLVLKNDSMDVAAWAGSADFFDAAHQGQVNGVNAVRSPGSTLKAFLLARGFDEGYLTPKLRVLDIPTDFGGYAPENYDGEYHGDVTVENALLQSLNIPAVRELARQGSGSFVSWLRQLGFENIARAEKQLGLSLVLGGCGATLEELTRAYTVFAREGRLSPLRFLRDDASSEGHQLLSEASAFLVSDILSKHTRPDIPADLLAASRLPKIAWKTGTSYGKRDAWAIGWNGRYTIGVWMGNFNGEGAPHLSGAVMAVPLLVDLFNAIDRGDKIFDVLRPSTIHRRTVCARTGLLPSPQCTETTDDWEIVECSTKRRCELMRPFLVDAARTVHYCMDCLPGGGADEVWFPVYPPELGVWFEENNIGFDRPPPHYPACTARLSGEGPDILSPSTDYTYYIEKGAEQQLLLHAASPAGVRKQFWYVDGDLLAEVAAGMRTFFQPTAKRHSITCMDDVGRKRTITIAVSYY